MNSDQQVHEQLPNASVERSDAVTSRGTFERRRILLRRYIPTYANKPLDFKPLTTNSMGGS